MANSKNLGKMKKVHAAAMDCIKHLVIVKGYSVNVAEEMVMTTLKESEEYLLKGMIDETVATLKMVHMDVSLEDSANDLIKSFLK